MFAIHGSKSLHFQAGVSVFKFRNPGAELCPAHSCSRLTAVGSQGGTCGQEAIRQSLFLKTGKTPVGPEVVIRRVRVALPGRSARSLEKVGADSIRGSKEKDLKVGGLV